MKRLLFLGLILCLFCSCRTKYVTAEPIVVHDTHTVKELVHDTLVSYVPVVDNKTNVVLPKDTSKLNNRYCNSWAWINSEGLLRHTLNTNQIAVQIPLQTREKIVTDTMRVPYPVPSAPVTIEKQLSAWQKFIQKCGYLLLALTGLSLGVGILKLTGRI